MPERPMKNSWLRSFIAAVGFIVGTIVLYVVVEWLGFR